MRLVQRIKEEDPEVIKKRRERNKIAAMKCRRLKRERIEKLEKVHLPLLRLAYATEIKGKKVQLN